MKYRYLNSPVLKQLLLSLSLFLLIACEENFPEQPEVTPDGAVKPSVDSARLIFKKELDTYFLEATVSDPQGFSDIDLVSYQIFITGAEFPFQSGGLNDDATAGDIIRGDGRYSATVKSSIGDFGAGRFTFVISAVDLEENISDTLQILSPTPNFPPEISLVSVTDSIAAGDTIIVELLVEDLNGSIDIRKVTYKILAPDDPTPLQDPTFFLRDDGKFGDNVPNDDIYTVAQPTNAGGSTGIFTFLITAEDFSGAKSTELQIPVTITN